LRIFSFYEDSRGLSVERVQWSDTFDAAASGLLFGLSLIVAIGPQNAFVLRQGLRGEHTALVVGVCAVSDLVMIAAGVAGAGTAFDGRGWLVTAFAVVGSAFLLGNGATAARRVVRPAGADAWQARSATAWRTALLACLAFTWLNPGVYIDTVFLVAPVSRTHAPEQWWFACGAMLASVGWFVALGYGARSFGATLSRPGAWRIVDACIALIMIGTAVRIAMSQIG
jgi:L-lysine exporter family protein LysE/ArgO